MFKVYEQYFKKCNDYWRPNKDMHLSLKLASFLNKQTNKQTQMRELFSDSELIIYCLQFLFHLLKFNQGCV